MVVMKDNIYDFDLELEINKKPTGTVIEMKKGKSDIETFNMIT